MEDNKENYDKDAISCPLGKEIAILRILLDQTVQQMADALHTSRVTLSKVEHAEDNTLITDDIAFRVYYLTQKIKDNPFKPIFVKDKAQYLQNRIEKEIILSKYCE